MDICAVSSGHGEVKKFSIIIALIIAFFPSSSTIYNFRAVFISDFSFQINLVSAFFAADLLACHSKV